MAARLEVVKGVASQRVWFNPQEGRPSSTPSVAIKDEAGSTITAAAATYVTQDTVNTTLSAAAAKGDRTVTLTAITGLVSRQAYLLTNTLHQAQWVTVVDWNDSTKVVTLEDRLVCACASASTFVGTGFYHTLQTAEVASLRELMRARATYTVASVSYVMEVNFDVVLTPLHNPLTYAFLRGRHPDLFPQEHAQTAGSRYQALREAAWDNVLKAIRRHGWRPGLVRTPDDLEGWALAEWRCEAWGQGIEVLKGADWDGPRGMEHLEGKRSAAALASLAAVDFYDENEDDSKADDEERLLRMDLIR